MTAASRPLSSRGRGLVASGMLLSRIAGVIRESVFAHYLGNSGAADAFKAGFRIPNILQNLLGEGVLSASFIPVYSRLLGEGEEEMADLLAWGVGAILALVGSVLVAVGDRRGAVPDHGNRAGVRRRQARTDDRGCARAVSVHRAAGDVGVVPRRAEQPSQIFHVVRGAGRIQYRDHRDAGALWSRVARRTLSRSTWRGARSSARASDRRAIAADAGVARTGCESISRR